MQHPSLPIPHSLLPAGVLHGAPFSGKAANVLRSLAVAVVLGGGLLMPTLIPSTAAAQEVPRKLLVVQLDPGSSGIDPDAVRQAIATELGVDVADQPVAGSIGTLLVRVKEDNQATVVFRAPDGKHSIERSVRLPQDPTLRHEAIALLAGNLARNEAKELADALEAARQARRLEKERQAREAAAQKAATDAAAAAGAAAAARVQAIDAEAKREAAVRVQAIDAEAKREAAAKAAAEAEAEAKREAAAEGEEQKRDQSQPTAKELHERINERVETQSAAFAEYDEYPLKRFQAALTSPVAIYPDATELRFNGMVSALYVDAGGLEGAAVTLGLHRIQGNVRGAQAAVVWNDVRGLYYGAQIAAIGNRSGGPLRGAEGAGILNLRAGAVQGAQGAGIFNWADAVEGAQGAGVYNHNEHELLGAQAASIANFSGSDMSGAQAAGVVNIAWGFVEGAQLAGVTNIADRSVDGAQIAGAYNQAEDVEGAQIAVANRARDVDGAQIGVVNIGRDIDGTQIGVVNISRDFKGFPVGLVNISQTGRYQLVLWHERKAELNPDTVGAGANIGVKFLVGSGYTLFGFGGDGRDQTWAANAALGARFPMRPLFIEMDIMYRGEWDVRISNENDAQAIHYRGKLGVEIVPKRFGVFVGGGVRHAFIPTAGQIKMEFGPIALAGVEVF